MKRHIIVAALYFAASFGTTAQARTQPFGVPDTSTASDEMWRRVSKHEFFGRTVTLKVKYADFTQITRGRTPGGFVTEFEVLWQTARELLSAVDYSQKPIRLMGLTVSNAQDLETPEVYQLEFDFGE